MQPALTLNHKKVFLFVFFFFLFIFFLRGEGEGKQGDGRFFCVLILSSQLFLSVMVFVCLFVAPLLNALLFASTKRRPLVRTT